MDFFNGSIDLVYSNYSDLISIIIVMLNGVSNCVAVIRAFCD